MPSPKLARLISNCYNGSHNILSNSKGLRKVEQALLLATAEGIDFEDFIRLHEHYLISNGCSLNHANDQIRKIREQMPQE